MDFICYDTEDNSKELMLAGKSGFLKKVTQIAAITASGETFYNKGNVPQFLKWLLQRPERMVFAHNVQYDLGNLFASDLTQLDCTLVGGRLIKAIWHKKKFVDSFNLWPMSAKKLGEAFGLAKLETESMATDKAYVFRDVEIIREAILFVWRMCERLGVENMPTTLGGLAVQVWKSFEGVNNHDSLEMSREAYFGGRVELFKVRNDLPTVAYTDINSLYPFVMTYDYPCELSPADSLPRHGIARVKIKVPKSEITVLPWRRKDGRIFYPWGTFEGTFTAPEIHAAVERGAEVLKVIQAYEATETVKPYQYYTTKLYRDRLASESPAEKLFFKLLMNNLYGRLGTTGEISRTVWVKDGQDVPSEKALVKYRMPLSAETNWSHAAYVTAYGRLELLKHLEMVGAEQLIYCDTDSTIFDAPGKKIPFSIGNELGQMKLESWETDCETFAPKMYRAGKKYKAKGVPVRLAKEYIETGKASFELPFKLREAIRFFDQDNARKLSVWRKVSKENRQVYDRKRLDGNRYFPCNVSEIS